MWDQDKEGEVEQQRREDEAGSSQGGPHGRETYEHRRLFPSAFSARTGKMVWTFHTIPHPGEYGCETWPKDGWRYLGAANCWAGMSLDEKRGNHRERDPLRDILVL